jgi:hypothetical protein
MHEDPAGLAALFDEREAVLKVAQDILFIIIQQLHTLVYKVLWGTTQ